MGRHLSLRKYLLHVDTITQFELWHQIREYSIEIGADSCIYVEVRLWIWSGGDIMDTVLIYI